jgi:hypothetical protein
MRRSIRVRLFAVLMTAAVGAGVAGGPAAAQAPAPEPTASETMAAARLAADWRVSMSEATARVQRQERVGALARELETGLGTRFGGVWIDHANGGRVVVGDTGGSTASLGAMASRHALAGLVTTKRVQFGLPSLTGAFTALSDGLAAANAQAAQPISVALRTELNKVELAVPSAPTANQRTYAAAAAAKYGPALRVVTRDERPEALACPSRNACDRPLQGGVHIHAEDGTTCTGGFNVQGGGRNWMLTAGHCLYYAGLDPWQYWLTKNSNGSNRTFGGAVQYWWYGGSLGRDFAIISIDNAAENPQPTIFASSSGRSITGTSTAVVGQYLCKGGQTSDYQCGDVTSTSVSATYTDGVTVRDMIRAGIYSCKGDSGGPAFLGNSAYGLLSGGTLNISSNCGDTVYIGKIGNALSTAGVTLL